MDVTFTTTFSHDIIHGTIVPDETVNVDEKGDFITQQVVPDLLMPPKQIDKIKSKKAI